MREALSVGILDLFRFTKDRYAEIRTPGPGRLSWNTLPWTAQLYVGLVVVSGTIVLVGSFPLAYPKPLLFLGALMAACLTAAWKVNLPIALTSGSTLSVSCAAKLMALLLLGPRHAVIVAVAGALTQCTYKVRHRYPLYRTVFSITAEVIAMSATGLVYGWLGGSTGPFEIAALAKPLVGAVATYFVFDTGLVAGAIASSTDRGIVTVWRDDFLWSGVTFMVAGTAGAVAAVVIDRGDHWLAVLLLAPVYLTYRTYELFVARLDDQQRHMADMRRMHQETVDALSQARTAERALGEEKERLAVALVEMTRLEQTRKELLEREHAARAAAEQANRLKDQFLAVVSHELRTPLNAILGWSEMLRRGKLDEPRRERAFSAIHDSAKRQAHLIEDLLDVARIMSGKLHLERTLVDLEDVARGALNVVQPAADAKHIHLGLDVDPSVGAVYVDRSRLQQVAWNLLSNAIKFTPKDGTVRMELRRPDDSVDSVEIVVTDSGIGISHDFLASMFEPFMQADGSTTRHHGGLGLGLSIVKHLVQAHGGVVTAHSAGEGQGATFIVRLPSAMASADQLEMEIASDMRVKPAWPPTLLEGLSVLVVDDEEQARQVVAAQLEEHGAVVLTAASVAQALDVLQREHVDVLLSDIAMPDEDGYGLIRKLRGLYPAPIASIPAAALTAFARNEDRLEVLHAGFQLHLAKPIDAHSLITAVARLGDKLLERRSVRAVPLNEPVAVQV
jgi:signal transduction histidine kinase/ActR/RegA family two-component response regulator